MRACRVGRYIVLGLTTLSLIVVIGIFNEAMSQLSDDYRNEPSSKDVELVADHPGPSSAELGKICQPEDATNLVLIAEATGSHEVFQIWRMNIMGNLVERTTTLFGTACGLANDSRYMQAFYEYVPRDVAEELAFQTLIHRIDDVGGLDAYRSSLMERLQPDGLSDGHLPRFSSIDVEAWKKVGLDIPTELYDIDEYQETEPYEF